MSFNLLKGKRGIIFGALNDASIAWKVAERAVEEGAQIVLTNTAVACRMGTIDELAKKTGAVVIPADATSVEDLTNLFVQAQEALGGKIDFVLHSCAMSVNMRKKRTYDDLDYGFLNKTLDISAISFHKMLQAAKKLDALFGAGSDLRGFSPYILRLQRYGGCQVAVGVDSPQLRLHLRSREGCAHQHHLSVAYVHHSGQWHQGLRRSVRLL